MAPTSDINTVAITNEPIDQLDVNDEKLATRRVDGALDFLWVSGDEGHYVDEGKLLRRIDLLVMPLIFGAYLSQFFDKSLVNYAAVMGISKDTGMSAAQFSYLATFFYVTYAVFQPLHAVLVQKLPVAKYLGSMVICWGVTVTMHCVCKSFSGLIVVRLLLGAFEAAAAPCLLLITGMWYKRAEQPLRIGCWYLCVGVDIILGALIMYLVCGILIVVLGALIVCILPDSPVQSRFSTSEKVAAIERLRANQTEIENMTWKWYQCRETMLDVKPWLIIIIILAGNAPTGATGSFVSLLIKGFGYTSKQSALLNIPSGLVQGSAVILASWGAGRRNARGYAIVCLLLPGVLGGGLTAFLPNAPRFKAAEIVGIYLCGIFGPNLSVMYSWAAANYAGHTKKVTINAVIIEYIPAKAAIMATLALVVAGTLVFFSVKYRHFPGQCPM